MLVSFFAPGSFLGLYTMAAVTRMNTGSHCEHTKHLIDTSAFPGYTSSFQSPKLELFRWVLADGTQQSHIITQITTFKKEVEVQFNESKQWRWGTNIPVNQGDHTPNSSMDMG